VAQGRTTKLKSLKQRKSQVGKLKVDEVGVNWQMGGGRRRGELANNAGKLKVVKRSQPIEQISISSTMTLQR